MQATKTTPLFAATLRPDRSFRTAGGWLGLLLAGIVGTPLVITIPEMLLPCLAAYGLASGGLIIFGLRQQRRGRQVQQVTLWADQLEIAWSSHGGEKEMRRFEPAKIKLRLVRDEFERTTGIFLRYDDGETELGAFLGRDDKSSFAKAFGTALRQARRAD